MPFRAVSAGGDLCTERRCLELERQCVRTRTTRLSRKRVGQGLLTFLEALA